MRIRDFAVGGYRYIEGVFQYSAGVAAAEGHEIVRARFRQAVPLEQGFGRIAGHLAEVGRPKTAFCACELRSPAPFTEVGFRDFNDHYVTTLARWGIFRQGQNPVARSNVCPQIDPPPVPAFYAFSYTRPAAGTLSTFVIAGSGEVPEGQENYRDHIVRRGDTGADALKEKARFVLSAMETRLAALGLDWEHTTDAQVYTVHDFHSILAEDIVSRGAARSGLCWHFARPPVVDLEFEMDCRGVHVELVI